VHYDLMAWNQSAKPGRPQGGEAMALRATFAAVQSWLAERES
jgi:leucyl aminopeptidase